MTNIDASTSQDVHPAARTIPIDDTSQAASTSPAIRPAWAAVASLALGVFALVTAEFLPASLLTPIAADFRITEGTAGQAVTATAAFALVSSLFVAAVIRDLDRRIVLLCFTTLLLLSNVLVAFAPTFPVLLAGRILLGLALGGFWSMAAALAMRLVPESSVPRALSMIFSGVSAATIVAAPIGSYLGHLTGWRSVFFLAAALSGITLIAQVATLPRLPAVGSARLGTLVDVLKRPRVGLGMICTMLVFTGHFAFFTYIRPFLETTTGASIETVSAVLLGFGIANLAGTVLAGVMLERSLRATLVIVPIFMAALGAYLAIFHGISVVDWVMVALWGLAFGAVPVAWSTWLTRAVPDQAESAGGLLVAAVQLAITIGAAGGGEVFDLKGAVGVFGASSLVLAFASLIILIGIPTPGSRTR